MKAIEKMSRVKKILIGMATVLLLNLIYLLFMMATYCLPTQGQLKDNIGDSLSVWVNEVNCVKPLFDDYGFYLDTFSDMIWANAATISTGNSFTDTVKQSYKVTSQQFTDQETYNNLVAALYYADESSEAEYSRYWNLQIGWIKILFQFVTIREVRFLLFSITSIIAFVLLLVLHREGRDIVIPIFMGIYMTSLVLHSTCLSFFGDIMIALTGMLFIACSYSTSWYTRWEYLVYIVIGSLTFANAPLVAPILTLGMCLLVSILLRKSDDRQASSWLLLISDSACWGLGYLGTLLFKQILSKLVLGYQTGTNTIVQWIGFEFGIGDRIRILFNNFERLFSPLTVKLPIIVLFIAFAVFGIIKAKRKTDYIWQIFFVSLYPIAWILLIARHAQHYFTSNILCIFIAGICSIMVSKINFDKLLKRRVCNITERNRI